MLEQPLVSVIVPCYNHERYIEECVLSVIQQSYKNIQLIVIDDGSKDNSRDIIKKMQIKYGFTFVEQTNSGISKTLNKGIKEYAKGKYIAFVASDDYWDLDKIEKQVAFFEENNSFGIILSKTKIIDNHSNILEGFDDNLFNQSYEFKEIALGKSFIPALTVMFKKEVFDTIGYFDESLIIEDLDMWLRIANKYSIGFQNEYLAFYRQHDTNASSKVIQMSEARFQILKKWENIKPALYDKIKRNWELRALIDFGKTNNDEALKYFNPTFKNFLHSKYRLYILSHFFKGHF
jgi:alpha-1,3-rhamnosyltransferase